MQQYRQKETQTNPKKYSYFDDFTGSAEYRLTEVDISGKETILDSLVVNKLATAGPGQKLLKQNPFRQKAVINAGEVNIYDVSGRRVAKLGNKNKIINWEAKNMPAGVYLFVGEVNNKRVVEKGVLIK